MFSNYCIYPFIYPLDGVQTKANHITSRNMDRVEHDFAFAKE
jgi:hypothetical protein